MKTIKRAAAFLLAGVVTAIALTGSSCGNGTPVVEAGPEMNNTPAQTFVEPCNKFAEANMVPGYNVAYAEHEFPGLTVADVASRVIVLGPSWTLIPGYTLMQRTEFIHGSPYEVLLVRDGAAAVVCGPINNLDFQTVTFVFR